MKKYLIKRTAILNGIKEASYIGNDCCLYDEINKFTPLQFINNKNTAKAILNRFFYGSLNCKVLNIEIIEI